MLKVNQTKDTDWPEGVKKCVHILPSTGFIFRGTHQYLVGFQILLVEIKIGISPRRNQNCNFCL